ncbi:hypothetical protein ANME2D_02352 [Candidatus Methanoperedens nitroreducens]|uniref:Uncharacterized protein n=1 Tax=Candidatus Methanoperedens nitratireducens TaxID=1392998 RepID=A0A062V2M0_9EURY|nr:hypothetical protein [Candidatus Methanoperedens nitroreducens]KCZ71617.1 hypothetical protein ANME2D_02352 [Candidatus Methanoperedens nitroreducens]MDJ1421247.1 hypothetical protein [Candidatus Methanoperedens sp.]
MSSKAHGRRRTTLATCDCELLRYCSEIKERLDRREKIFRCPIVARGI